jgi:hypothetical protein
MAMKHKQLLFHMLTMMILLTFFCACSNESHTKGSNNDSVIELGSINADSAINKVKQEADSVQSNRSSDESVTTSIKSNAIKMQTLKVKIYYFHVTNRCPSCIAIENATQKTLDTYFSKEVKNGAIKFYMLNVDEDTNKEISEKYQAFGSALFVTGIKNRKENPVDLTGDGFKFARNKEDKFISILKSEIEKALK